MGLGTKITLVSLASLVAALGAYLYQKKKKEIIPWTWEEVGQLKKLNLFPLKSGHRIELTKAECTKYGLRQTKDEDAVQLRDRYVEIWRFLMRNWDILHGESGEWNDILRPVQISDV